MKHFRTLSLLALVLAITCVMTGCQNLLGESDSSGTQDTDYYDETYYTDLNYPLDDPDGGYDTTDESPAFGDPAFDALFTYEEDVLDPFNDSNEVDEMEDLPERAIHYLRLAWGQLNGSPGQEIVTNWSGTIGVDRGAVVVLRRIHFEPGTDRLILSRSNVREFELETLTSVHYDGLLLKIIDPDPGADDLNMLTIDMGPGQVSVLVAALDGYQDIIDVDDIGNQMSLQSPTILEVDNGFLHGIWYSGPNTERGVFRGGFLNYDGRLRGYVRGHWGINGEGEKVFKGKYIARNGQFLGIIRGHWTPDVDSAEMGRGVFSGQWRDRDGVTQGALGGHYLRGFRRGGYFSGRWVEECGL
ncbi:MAG: hypothetical protein GY835_00820 [bacterium]|nr:hypothetical protein [bacterium]